MSYKQLGRSKTLTFFSWAGTHMGFRFHHSVVDYMLDFLCRRKLFDDMKCLLITASLHNQGSVSCKALSICIRFLGRNGRIREALSLFEEMGTVFRCEPDNLVYNNMLYVLCKRQSSEEMVDLALSIFHRIQSPDTYSCSNMLVGLCKVGRLEAALEIFGRMDEIGVLPSRSAMNILIGELCSMSAKEGSVEKTEEAVDILMIAEERKLTCVGEGYSIVIQALCKHRRVEEVSKLFGRMLQHGLKPKLVVYNSIISMLCKLGNLSHATRVYEIMNKKRCLPDNTTYAALIHANGERKNWKVAYDLLTEMLGFGWIPHFHTYNLVESLLREHDQLDLCCKLERKLENKKLQKLCKNGQLDAAYEKAKSMLEQGICLSQSARDTLQDVFQKCGKLNVVRQLLDTTNRV
ncbi:hypothetical protein PIB30_021224 [Stylosanthes scabra]|uniref:Pentatricopeptide repeat-containing protein n=1 Tax=Stylosanthes scabra TaxID=79078 RepID=A0ABU6VAD2_9FABA|nr:hypothetical protein [Stylosanthes scabra]